MQVPVIKIGNSRGIRLNKALLELYGIGEIVDLKLEQNQIVIKPVSEPRKGWEKSFKEMADKGDDELLFDDVFHDEDFEKWK
ncbi:MAG: AbrB/MazE/SpoVT family DNA-binding domain-containing protein [Bacteroidales bacterium]|nr:AbrB/MazE/SpoVT family DNA-binding domain-containing protein [Bacteroidales bacterium]MCF8337321.1 AbrB/MazE/SpoVT family DNA-binding domain-containing protein [Bacteroidales bacterium]